MLHPSCCLWLNHSANQLSSFMLEGEAVDIQRKVHGVRLIDRESDALTTEIRGVHGYVSK